MLSKSLENSALSDTIAFCKKLRQILLHSSQTLCDGKVEKETTGDPVERRTLIVSSLIISGLLALAFVVVPSLLSNSEEITPMIKIIRFSSDPEALALLQQLENQTLPTITNWTYILSNTTLEGHIIDLVESASNISKACTTPSFSLYWNVSVTRNETTLNYSKLSVLWKLFSDRFFNGIYLIDTDLFFWWVNETKTIIDPFAPYQLNVTSKSHSIKWVFCGLVMDSKVCRPLAGYWRFRKQMLILDHDLLPVVFAEGHSKSVS